MAEYSPVRAQRILSKRILSFNMRSSSPHDPPHQTVLKRHTPSILNAGKIWYQHLCDSTAFTPPSMTLKDYTQLQTAFKWEINSHPFQLWASDGDKRVLCLNQVSVEQNTDIFQVQKLHRAVCVAKGERHLFTACPPLPHQSFVGSVEALCFRE